MNQEEANVQRCKWVRNGPNQPQPEVPCVLADFSVTGLEKFQVFWDELDLNEEEWWTHWYSLPILTNP